MGASVWDDDRYDLKRQADPGTHFQIEEVIVKQKSDDISLQLKGTLTTVNQGTHVVGTITESSRQALRYWQFNLLRKIGLVSVVVIVLLIVGWSSFIPPNPIEIVLALAIVGTYLFAIGSSANKARSRSAELVQRVYSALYVLPD